MKDCTLTGDTVDTRPLPLEAGRGDIPAAGVGVWATDGVWTKEAETTGEGAGDEVFTGAGMDPVTGATDGVSSRGDVDSHRDALATISGATVASDFFAFSAASWLFLFS